MENTILIGDRMFFNQFIYGPSTPRSIPLTNIKLPYFRFPAVEEPKRGDIVNFDFPGHRDEVVSSENVQYLKRIVGQPGDVVEVKDRVLYVNGEVFPNPIDGIFVGPINPKGIINDKIFPKGTPWTEDNYGTHSLSVRSIILNCVPTVKYILTARRLINIQLKEIIIL
jgi:signal peptidase I